MCQKKFSGKFFRNFGYLFVNYIMGKIVRLTESDIVRLVKRIINEEEEYSPSFKRRFKLINDVILGLIDKAKEETDEDDFDDYYDYLENLVYWVVQELQSMYGDEDDFWYDNESEITDFIKDEYDEHLE